MNYKKIKFHIKKNLTNYLLSILILIFVLSFLNVKTFQKDITYPQMESSNFLAKSSMDFESVYADILIETKNFEKSKDDLKSLIEKNKGKKLSEKNINDDDLRELEIKIEINKENFDNFKNELNQIGKIKNLNVETFSEKENYQNLNERLERYKTQIEKYKSLLEKEKTIEEEISLNQRIDNLENQIFYLEKQINDTKKRTEKYTFSITLKEITFLNSDFSKFKDYVNNFLISLQNSFLFFLKLIAYALPFLLVYFTYKIVKRKSK